MLSYLTKKLAVALVGVFLVTGVLAGAALADKGNPPNGKGGNPPSGPGNVCDPGYHGVPAGSGHCVHNGDGAGNCDQNQSGNTGNGAGNGGNDYGNGNKQGCDEQPAPQPTPCPQPAPTPTPAPQPSRLTSSSATCYSRWTASPPIA